MVVGIQISGVWRHDGERDLPPRRADGEFQIALGGRHSLVLDAAARWKARRRYEPDELSLVHSGLVDRQQRLERILCRVLRLVARQHALPGFHCDTAAVRFVGRWTEDAGEVRCGRWTTDTGRWSDSAADGSGRNARSHWHRWTIADSTSRCLENRAAKLRNADSRRSAAGRTAPAKPRRQSRRAELSERGHAGRRSSHDG